jgi:hypothetical protein
MKVNKKCVHLESTWKYVLFPGPNVPEVLVFSIKTDKLCTYWESTAVWFSGQFARTCRVPKHWPSSLILGLKMDIPPPFFFKF